MRTERPAAIDSVLAGALAAPILMIIALSGSFLKLTGGGAVREASVIDAVAAIATSTTWPLAIAVGALIVALPTMRALALIYVLFPIRFGYAPARHAAAVFRFAIAVRPWSMAEIFLIGVAVALVKVSGLAVLTIGPAFWALSALALIMIAEDAALCERSIWGRLA